MEQKKNDQPVHHRYVSIPFQRVMSWNEYTLVGVLATVIEVSIPFQRVVLRNKITPEELLAATKKFQSPFNGSCHGTHPIGTP